MSILKRIWPLLLIAAAFTAFFAFGGPKYISLDSLRENQDVLKAIVTDHYAVSVIGFVGLYALLTSVSIPGASLLTIFGGFLFGLMTGTIAVVIGATIGATLLFLAARYVFGESLAAKAGPFVKKFEAGLKDNEIPYLFILRLVPIFPFFIVNIVPALFDVKLRNYVVTTFFGIIPGSLVYVSVGNGLGDALSAGQEVPLTGLMTRPAVLLPLVGLIALSLIPIVYKKMSAKSAS